MKLVSCTLLAVQLVALALVQVRVLEPPSAMLAMLADKAAVTAGPTVMVTESTSTAPPSPAPPHSKIRRPWRS